MTELFQPRKVLSTIDDGPQVDSLYRLQSTTPYTIFDDEFTFGMDPYMWDTIVANGGTIVNNTDTASEILSVSTASGSRAMMQTHQYLRYQPGKSQVVNAGFLFGAPTPNVIRRIGQFDDNNGFFLEQNGITDVAFVIRSDTSGSVVDTRTTQPNWNSDRYDGSTGLGNLSGLTIDFSKMTLLSIDYNWPTGRIRFGFVNNGRLIYAHQDVTSSTLNVPITRTPNLPIRCEILTTAATVSTQSMKVIACSLICAGGQDPLSRIRSVDRQVTGVSVSSGSRSPIISIRPKLNYNGRTNRGIIYPIEVSLKTSSDTEWGLYYRPTLTGATFTSVDNYSITEYDTAATAITVTGAIRVAGGYMATGQTTLVKLIDLQQIHMCLDAANNQTDIFSLTCQSLSGAATVFGEITWHEHI